MNPNDIVLAVSENVDQIKYADTEKSWKVSDQITIDWRNVLPRPPNNSSEQTLKELQYLSRVTNRLSFQQKELVELVDDEPLELFKPTLKKYGLTLDRPRFKEVWKITRPVIMNLKWMFNRPRPDQLAPRFGLNINIIQSKTHRTPAYPSGHTAYAAMGAHLLSARYPEYSGLFFRSVKVAAYARCLQGVHYPSDNAVAMAISAVIWEDIKYTTFLETETV